MKSHLLLYLSLVFVFYVLSHLLLKPVSLGHYLNNHANHHTNHYHVNYDYYEALPWEPRNNIAKRRSSLELLTKLREMVIPNPTPSPNKKNEEVPKDFKLVLFWTSWFKRPWWRRVGGGLDLVAAHCPEFRCYFTHDRSRFQEAAAVLFQVRCRPWITNFPGHRFLFLLTRNILSINQSQCRWLMFSIFQVE